VRGDAWVLLAAAVLASAAAAQPGARGGAPSYRIECASDEQAAVASCRVDTATFVGRLVFNNHCASCHAEDALGSGFAPELGPRIRRLSYADFASILDNGYAGLGDALPPWGESRDVARYYVELWSYLSARASGELPPGPLMRLLE
jgi:mono/diheme cytochrome c family protein